MNHVNSLIRLIDKGLSAQVMLNDGSMIVGFWPHDIIARGKVEAGVVVVRGMICIDLQSPQDHIIPLCDIGGVFSEHPQKPFAVDPKFYQRNPVARGWTVIHARLPNAVTTR